MMRQKFLYLLTFVLLFLSQPVTGQEITSIASKASNFSKMDGYVPIYWDASAGKVWMEVSRWEEDFLYLSALSAGLGSNDIGLDRGLLGTEYVVHFKRVGPKVLLIAPNQEYRAVTDNTAEQKAVADAFAHSVLWSFEVAAETEGTVLVDATLFLLQDVMGISRRISSTGQGTFRLDTGKSAPLPEHMKAFPQNTEMEVLLTFSSENPGRFVREVAANPYSISLRVRHSMIELPELGSYTPRELDPRSGAYGITYIDYATAISQPKEKHLAVRHRLEKQDPEAESSPVVEPIVYYLDPGTPEPIRSALLDGARWWADAFEAAGFIDAYQVEMLPEDADPLDIRYNVIQWVHRSTRGWSYGRSVRDPRTGEILKGQVSLGSLRVRQDYLIAEGLLAPYGTDSTRSGLSPDNDPMLEMALARLRQLSAHEIGHTIGFMHNFASSVNDRASVMDYPAPLATLDANGEITLNEAYDVGIGEWDKVSVRHLYGQFPSSVNEKEALDQILEEAHAAGLQYISDTDARPQGGAHPTAHLWDNRSNPVEGLEEIMAVREKALSTFGLANLPEGRPLAQLEEVLVPLYLNHRYQVEGVSKLIGGINYNYTMRGDTQSLPEPLSRARQMEGLMTLLNVVQPENLRLPPNIRTQLPPRPPAYGPHRELFDGHTGLTFDPYAPAEVVTRLVFSLILQPERLSRLAYQSDFDSTLPDLAEVLDTIFDSTWEQRTSSDPYDAGLMRLAQQTYANLLLDVLITSKTAHPVRAQVQRHLRDIQQWLETNPGSNIEEIAHRDLVYDDINRVLSRDYVGMETRATITTPPGSPIGQDMEQLPASRFQQSFMDRWLPEQHYCSFSE